MVAKLVTSSRTYGFSMNFKIQVVAKGCKVSPKTCNSAAITKASYKALLISELPSNPAADRRKNVTEGATTLLNGMMEWFHDDQWRRM